MEKMIILAGSVHRADSRRRRGNPATSATPPRTRLSNMPSSAAADLHRTVMDFLMASGFITPLPRA